MSKKKALGQGLDALLGDDFMLDISDEGVKQNNGGVVMIPIEEISPNPEQPRRRFDEAALKELAESIKQQGIIQPILVSPKKPKGYLLVAGERRWRASHLAEIKEIPVIIKDLSPEEKLEIALVENVQREDLTALEEAQAYQKLMEVSHLSQQELADKVGKNRSTVANSLRLLKLPPPMRDAMEKKQISAGHARALLSVVTPEKQERLFTQILREGFSVRRAEMQAGKINKESPQKPPSPPSQVATGWNRDPELDYLEQRFIELLGTKVSLRGSLDRGRIEIAWFSQSDLDRIYKIMVNNEE